MLKRSVQPLLCTIEAALQGLNLSVSVQKTTRAASSHNTLSCVALAVELLQLVDALVCNMLNQNGALFWFDWFFVLLYLFAIANLLIYICTLLPFFLLICDKRRSQCMILPLMSQKYHKPFQPLY